MQWGGWVSAEVGLECVGWMECGGWVKWGGCGVGKLGEVGRLG